jgi:hypothetical protein
MEINLPPEQQQQLAAFAKLRGFESPEEYASSIVSSAVQLEAFAELAPEEMAESVASIERGIEQAKKSQGIPAEQAINEIAKKYGLKLPQ